MCAAKTPCGEGYHDIAKIFPALPHNTDVGCFKMWHDTLMVEHQPKQLDTGNLWSASRRSGPRPVAQPKSTARTKDERTPFELDHDRLLFSTPIRRMADKTQVFPLDRNDSVRTRLTHSHEVANLARSIGNRLVRSEPGVFGSPDADAAAPVILASAGLAHDLGNPPFGHQGEATIRRWFKKNAENLFQRDGLTLVDPDLQEDFLNFEGNAQILRLVSCLQVSIGGFGLDLTAATLASLMKYTVPAYRVVKSGPTSAPGRKKPGFLASEQSLVDWIRNETGIGEGARHPLAWLMEACDDIAYRVIDIEDTMKKSIVSPEDVLAYLRRQSKTPLSKDVVSVLDADFKKADRRENVSEQREIKAGYLRARLIETLVTSAADAFLESRENIFAFQHEKELLLVGAERDDLYHHLKAFARTHAYSHESVLKAELGGATAMAKILDWLWEAVSHREEEGNAASKRSTPFASYVYNAMISENYRCEFERSSQEGGGNLPRRYRELQLLTDMIAGMTDGFVMQLYKDLEPLRHA